jgi:hypothetical protein
MHAEDGLFLPKVGRVRNCGSLRVCVGMVTVPLGAQHSRSSKQALRFLKSLCWDGDSTLAHSIGSR